VMHADELKALRRRIGMTQAHLAEALGLSIKWVGLMERGDAAIELRTELAVRYLVVSYEAEGSVTAAISDQGEVGPTSVRDIGTELRKIGNLVHALAAELNGMPCAVQGVSQNLDNDLAIPDQLLSLSTFVQ